MNPISGARLTHDTSRPLRVLLTKTGLDGHDRGMKVVAFFLRNAGIDVIYLGIHCSTDTIVGAAIDEDVDVIGLSSLGGTHLAHSREIIEALRRRGVEGLPVIIGGTIPVEDFPVLEQIGVRGILRQGSTQKEIVNTISRVGQAARAVRTQVAEAR